MSRTHVRCYVHNLKSFGRSTRCSKFPSPSSKNKTRAAARRRTDFLREFHAALFQFRLRRVNRVHAQRDVAETGELVVAAVFRQRRVRRRKSQTSRRPAAPSAASAVVWPLLKISRAPRTRTYQLSQGDGIRRRDGNVFKGDVHALNL